MSVRRQKCNNLETGCSYIDEYLNKMLDGEIPASKEMLKACELIKNKLGRPGVVIKNESIEKAKELIERYFEVVLLPWEMLIIALVHCYEPDETLVFSEFLVVMGRGNGKNGFISCLTWYLTTRYHGVRGYNIDIIANSEDQAETSFSDVFDMLDRTWKKSKAFFTKTKQVIMNRDTGSYIKFNTSNARTKDGKRSACLIFDEIHEYENSAIIRTFRSGFGKRKHSRIFYITTNGYVRDGVLDDKLAIANQVLSGEMPKSRICPLIFKMDSEDEVKDRDLWEKACPSFPYFKALQIEMDQEFIDMEFDNTVELDFFTKRMNLPKTDMEIAVTDWKNIESTCREIPDLTGWMCTVGIDYASLRDWASVNFHFRDGDFRYDINHSWFCTSSPDLKRIKAPWRDWASCGLITAVNDVEIPPELLVEYIAELGRKYSIASISMDNFRFALLRGALEGIGFSASNTANKIKLIRPSDVMKVQPVIDSCFNKQLFCWGENPPLRWATNNTKLVRQGKKQGIDTGNYYYAKIEAKSRKTDPFMALVHSMVLEEELEGGQSTFDDLPVIM